MVRTAILVSGSGALLQTILDSMYFGEIPNYELVTVICSDDNAYAQRRCANAGVKPIVLEPADFATMGSYSRAVADKLRDMDVELVVLAGYEPELGEVAKLYKNKIIGVYPSLVPMFEDSDNPAASALSRGCRVAGATSYFADADGKIGAIIGQQAVEIRQDDTLDTLRRRIMEEGEWKLLPKSIILYCQGSLEVCGDRVFVKED